MASAIAAYQCLGSTSVPSGWGRDAEFISAPVSESRTTTFTDCVDESTPRTFFIILPRRPLSAREPTDPEFHSCIRASRLLQHQNCQPPNLATFQQQPK